MEITKLTENPPPGIDLSKAALLALIFTALSVALPIWNATRNLAFLLSAHRPGWWRVIPLLLLAYLFTASEVVFCFALFWNRGVIHIPKRLRLMAIAGIVALGICAAGSVPQIISSLESYRAGIGTIHSLTIFVNELSNLASMLVLIVLFRQAVDEPDEPVAISRLLYLASIAAVLLTGLWTAFNLLRLVASPLIYLQLQRIALPVNYPYPSLIKIASENNLAFLSGAGLFAAPYIIYQSQRDRLR
jgi:hypothetical protein